MASFRSHSGATAAFLVAVVLGLCTIARPTEFAGGTGEPNDPYQIATAEQLIAIGSDPNLLNKHFALVADIDLDPNLPGGRVFDRALIAADATGFSGSFNGHGKTIANLHIIGQYYLPAGSTGVSEDSTGDTRVLVKSHYIGLFRTISPEGSVSNLNFRDVRIDGGRFVAPLAVENQGAIINCRVQGVVNGVLTVGGLVATNKGFVACCHTDIEMTLSPAPGAPTTGQSGGLIGYHQNGLVTQCSARGSITGNNRVGGLIGEYWAQVTHCWAAVDITTPSLTTTSPGSGIRTLADNVASGWFLGGLAGYSAGPPSLVGLQDCYAIGSITAGSSSREIGGLAGDMSGSTVHCYAATRIVVGEGSSYVGGLAGRSRSTDWQGCFFLDPNDGGGPDNKIGTRLTDAQMRRRDSFTGWDFFGDAADGQDDPWFMPENSYPVLTGQTEVTGLIHVPDLRGVPLNQAMTVIESLGLKVGEIAEDWYTDVERGRILEITPHGVLPSGGAVQVLVSAGPYPWAEENPGDGSPSNPYQIQTRGQFLELARHPEMYDKCFVLMCDIDLGDMVFQQPPIAANAAPYGSGGTAFSGHFDGGLHTISNLILSPASATDIGSLGLFGSVAPGGKISRLRIEKASLNYPGISWGGGLLCGYNQGEIRDCYAGGEVSCQNGSQRAGGLAGLNTGLVMRSVAEARLVFVDPAAGKSQGLAEAGSGSIHISRGPGSSPLLAAAPQTLGVLVGANYGVITDCQARGSVTGSQYSTNLGGLVGGSGEDSLVASCYCVVTTHGPGTATGKVIATYYGSGTVANSYYLLDPALPDPPRGYGIGLTDSQMRQQASWAGFDFAGRVEDGTTDAWVMPQDGGYPVLADERPFELAGQGTEAEPYLIGSVQDVGLIRQRPEACYRLTNDIDCSGILWSAMIVPWFSGTLDGAGHRISYVAIFTTGAGGLLGTARGQATIRDLHMDEVDIEGGSSSYYVGSVACINYGVMLNCSATGRISGGGCMGGLAGKNGGLIYACQTNVALVAAGKSNYVGGLIGYNRGGTVVGCRAAGPVTASPESGYVGGLIGRHGGDDTLLINGAYVAHCCSTGAVTGASGAGGLIGLNCGRVAYCLAAGLVTGAGKAGGLVASQSQGAIGRCYFLDPNDGGGPDNGYGRRLSAAPMAMMDSFVGWDFVERDSDGFANTWSLPAAAPYPLPSALNTDVLPELDGAGTPDSPYLIRSAADFCAISRDIAACYRLDADLDLAVVQHTCPLVPLFMGHFDGGGHGIAGFSLAAPCYGGLFGVICSGASVKDLSVTDANIVGVEEASAMGVLAGLNRGDLAGCQVQGQVQGNSWLGGVAGACVGPLNMSGCTALVSILVPPGRKNAGGLVGECSLATLSDCGAVTMIEGGDTLSSVGGAVGLMNGGTITRCFARGDIIAGDNTHTTGGLVGSTSGAFSNSYAGVNITLGAKARYIGGLTGWTNTRIEYCYSRGAISVGEGRDTIGGLAPIGPIPWASFWDQDTSGIQTSNSLVGRTTAGMQMGLIYQQAGWDFANTWSICEGKDYPHLQWEQVGCK